MCKYRGFFAGLVLALGAGLSGACDKLDASPELPAEGASVSLQEVAQLLAALPLGEGQMEEVRHATAASAANGYDEEYRMRDLFAAPGAGVGDLEAGVKAGLPVYDLPMRELLREAVMGTKASAAASGVSGQAFLDSLAESDVQIYWPYSESWDGSSRPVVTFDPGDYASSNEGYELGASGQLKKVLVTEETAMERPVWVVSRNTDAAYKTLEMLRREDPSWGQGGDIVVRPGSVASAPSVAPRAHSQDFKTLVLRSFQSSRHYDSWFAGASEFWVKIGAVEDFTASTDAELRLYQPSITDFMIVMRRRQLGQELPLNAVLVSEWTGQLSSIAFMLLEDDGGNRTSWKCSAMVKYNSKSFGFELEIPLYTRDDIVWRGSLSRNYLERYSGSPGHFGDVTLVLELI